MSQRVTLSGRYMLAENDEIARITCEAVQCSLPMRHTASGTGRTAHPRQWAMVSLTMEKVIPAGRQAIRSGIWMEAIWDDPEHGRLTGALTMPPMPAGDDYRLGLRDVRPAE